MNAAVTKPMAPTAFANRQMKLKMAGIVHPIKSYHEASVYIGEFFEELVANFLEADHLKTIAAHFCPDLHKGNALFECKAMRHRGNTLLTIEQIDKYESVKTKFRIVYAFSIHTVKAGNMKSQEELFDELGKKVEAVYLIDAEIVHTVRSKRRIEADNPLYRPFVRCLHTDLEKWFDKFGKGITYGIGLEAKDRAVKSFPVYLVSEYAGQVIHMKGGAK